MKTVTSGADQAVERARQELLNNRSAQGRQVGHLRVIEGQQPANLKARLPPESPPVEIEISEEGRALLSRMAERAERELMHESGDETIARFVADGIDEGWIE